MNKKLPPGFLSLGTIQPRLILLSFVLMISFALLLNGTGCRWKGIADPTTPQTRLQEHIVGQRGGKLTYRVSSPPQTFNYLKAADESSLMVAFYLMGGRLVEFDHDVQEYVPGLAESWNLSNDEKSVVLVLRDGIQFSDGHPVTAEDIDFTLRAVYDERTASVIFRDAMLVGGRQIAVEILDARRLRLTFPETVARPENYLSNLAILPKHVLEAEFNRGALREAYSLTSDPQTVVTAGAFAAESASPGEHVTLKRNPHYWKKDAAGNSLPYLDQLTIEVISDANNAITRLRQGALDVFDRIRAADYAALRSSTETAQAFDLGPGLNTDHLWFNLNETSANNKSAVSPAKRSWFTDVRFRRAVSKAIDRKSIASFTLQGLASPLYGFVSPGNRAWVATNLSGDDYDLEKAKALLRDAGFVTRGDQNSPQLYDAKGNRVELTLIVPTESQARIQMATVIQEDLARLGIKLQVAPLEFGEFQRRTTQSFVYDAALLGTSVSEPDPSSYANFLRSSSPTHPWHPNQAHAATAWETIVDELLTGQARETNPKRRRQAFHQIQQLMAEQVPVIPIVARHLASAANVRVRNYRPSVLIPYSLWNAEELFVRQP